jgi:arylformamidase
MLAKIEHRQNFFMVDFRQPIDISIPMRSGDHNPNAFGIQPPLFEPFNAGGFVGSVALGGSVNCENLFINAHGNGTHTECVGHISKERITIYDSLKQFLFTAQLITVSLHDVQGDRMVLLKDIEERLDPMAEAVVIRTLPNQADKLIQHYSGNNPAYLEKELCLWLCNKGIKHLVIDLPSVDREEDGGTLAAHHAFWNYPAAPRTDATITEMAYIPDSVEDGFYFLNLQAASLQTDASPSKPVLYKADHVL